MNITILGWGGLILILFVTTFGIWWCITLTFCLLIFVVGGLTLLYLKHGESSHKYYISLYRSRTESPKPGINKVLLLLDSSQSPYRLDRRLTGSQVIDESLQEIIGYVLRDYVSPWYNRVSTDEEFPHEVRKTAQKVIVTFACRMKEVDWIPYLTTRMVDDAASHLRLFRQARTKMKQRMKQNREASSSSSPSESKRSSSSSKPSSAGDQLEVLSANNVATASSTTTVTTTTVTTTVTTTATTTATTTKLPPVDLESIFFDLEVTMEDNLLCRDLVCMEKENERQYLQDLSEVLLYLLLPADDFHCKPLRFLLRELLVSSVIMPLLNLFSDPDYINQIIIWLCKEIPMTSEVFLTALRVTDNKEELYATRDLVTKEIGQLRSRDSGGEDDTSIKQQLSSLMYLRKVIDNRLTRLKEGADTDSVGFHDCCDSVPSVAEENDASGSNTPEGLPSHIDWNRLLTPGCKLFALPLDVVLKNNIALAYFIDYMTSIGSQAYLFFYLNVEGWRVSAEQQISDHELQKLKGAGDLKLANPTMENMKEAAYSIFEQYLSEKKKNMNNIGISKNGMTVPNESLPQMLKLIDVNEMLRFWASPRIRIDETLVKRLLFKLRTENPAETWFDEVQAAVYDKLQSRHPSTFPCLPYRHVSVNKPQSRPLTSDQSSWCTGGNRHKARAGCKTEERFLPGFRSSVGYVKLLAELDLLKDPSSRSDEEDSQSLDEMSLSDSVSLASFDSDLAGGTMITDQAAGPSTIGGDAVTPVGEAASSGQLVPLDGHLTTVNLENDPVRRAQLQQGPFTLAAEIIETGIVNDHGKTYGIYAVSVAKRYETGYQEKWHVYRRYSDFHDLHQKVKEKYGDLGKLTFPGKKTFHNMERAVLEKRMKMLNDYLQILLQAGVMETHPSLQGMVLAFLEQGDYDRGVTGGQISRTYHPILQAVAEEVSQPLLSLPRFPSSELIDTLVNPLKSSMRSVGQAVRTMPDNLLSTVDGVMDGISKVFQTRTIRPSGFYESMKVGASLHVETDDNIPLRIMLLLMDEVFDLKSRNQWLRRRIVTLLRQIIRTMFGDIVNRRILDYVSWMTSPEQVADYLRAFKQSIWPNGSKAEPKLPRDEATRMRTRVAAKVALLSSLSDELKHIIGSETTRRGLLCVFELFQHPVLNRRLLYVLLEGILETLFPQHNLPTIFRKLHSRSSRVRDDFKTLQRSRQDLRR